MWYKQDIPVLVCGKGKDTHAKRQWRGGEGQERSVPMIKNIQPPSIQQQKKNNPVPKQKKPIYFLCTVIFFCLSLSLFLLVLIPPLDSFCLIPLILKPIMTDFTLVAPEPLRFSNSPTESLHCAVTCSLSVGDDDQSYTSSSWSVVSDFEEPAG